MRVKLPFSCRTPSDGLLLGSKLLASVGGIVERVGVGTGAQTGSGGDLVPSGSETKSTHCLNNTCIIKRLVKGC